MLKGYFGQSRWNSADTLADLENPVARAQLRYEFVSCSATRTTNCDLNGNRLLDGPQELGQLISTVGGGGFVRIDRDIVRPTSNELSVSVEREIVESAVGTGVVRLQEHAQRVGRDRRHPGAGVHDPVHDQRSRPGRRRRHRRRADVPDVRSSRQRQIGSDRVFTNLDDFDADFHTVEFAVNRRFAGKWMLLTSFGYTWSSMLHETTGYQRMVGHSLQHSTQPPAYIPARRLFGDNGIETSTLWNYKAIGRYVMPFDVGVSGSWRVQSGQHYGRTINVNFPGDGTRTIRVEPIDANRYPNISILDFRADKSFRFGRAGKLTGDGRRVQHAQQRRGQRRSGPRP